MQRAVIEHANGWGYEVTFPGEAEPVEVSDADVEAEFARRVAAGESTGHEAAAEKHAIAEELARATRDSQRGRRAP